MDTNNYKKIEYENVTLNFGQYNGQHISKIPNNYLNWVLESNKTYINKGEIDHNKQILLDSINNYLTKNGYFEKTRIAQEKLNNMLEKQIFNNEFYGEIGQRVELELTIINIFKRYNYIFNDDTYQFSHNGNLFIWFCCSDLQICKDDSKFKSKKEFKKLIKNTTDPNEQNRLQNEWKTGLIPHDQLIGQTFKGKFTIIGHNELNGWNGFNQNVVNRLIVI
jgi:uncharacterized protein (DUF3820 family)